MNVTKPPKVFIIHIRQTGHYVGGTLDEAEFVTDPKKAIYWTEMEQAIRFAGEKGYSNYTVLTYERHEPWTPQDNPTSPSKKSAT